jgi:hypothetical protein
VKATVEWNPRFQRLAFFFLTPLSFSRLLVPPYCVTRSLFPFSFPKELDKCGRLRWTN